eukprot:7179287-Alexandrium_andersonii.AAC.1
MAWGHRKWGGPSDVDLDAGGAGHEERHLRCSLLQQRDRRRSLRPSLRDSCRTARDRLGRAGGSAL